MSLEPVYAPAVTNNANIGAGSVSILDQLRVGEESRLLQGELLGSGFSGTGSILTIARLQNNVPEKSVEVELPIGAETLRIPLAAFVAVDDRTLKLVVKSDNAADSEVDFTVTLWPAIDPYDVRLGMMQPRPGGAVPETSIDGIESAILAVANNTAADLTASSINVAEILSLQPDNKPDVDSEGYVKILKPSLFLDAPSTIVLKPSNARTFELNAICLDSKNSLIDPTGNVISLTGSDPDAGTLPDLPVVFTKVSTGLYKAEISISNSHVVPQSIVLSAAATISGVALVVKRTVNLTPRQPVTVTVSV